MLTHKGHTHARTDTHPSTHLVEALVDASLSDPARERVVERPAARAEGGEGLQQRGLEQHAVRGERRGGASSPWQAGTPPMLGPSRPSDPNLEKSNTGSRAGMGAS